MKITFGKWAVAGAHYPIEHSEIRGVIPEGQTPESRSDSFNNKSRASRRLSSRRKRSCKGANVQRCNGARVITRQISRHSGLHTYLSERVAQQGSCSLQKCTTCGNSRLIRSQNRPSNSSGARARRSATGGGLPGRGQSSQLTSHSYSSGRGNSHIDSIIESPELWIDIAPSTNE